MKLSTVMTRTIVALSLAALAASCAGTSSSPPLPPEPPPGFRVIEQGQRSDEANGISTAYQVLASSTKASDGLHYNLKSLAADGWTTQETPRGDICLSRSRDDGSVEMLDAWRYDGQKGFAEPSLYLVLASRYDRAADASCGTAAALLGSEYVRPLGM